ncbi:MAG: RNA-directed DNA polymerase [Saprospiraceae bacterium]|nr:RNA-directed DNA polymerase [Saprospiraceae bacterium]
MAIFDQIIDSYQLAPGRGVPIGNLTSQYFANHYLSELDHFVKEQLKCKAYVRYMDDLILWHPQKVLLKHARRGIEDYVSARLNCQMKPSLLNSTARGLPFLGYLNYPHHIRLSQRSKQRFIRKFHGLDRHFHQGDWDATVCQRRAMALITFTRYADSLHFRRSVVNRLNSYGDDIE